MSGPLLYALPLHALPGPMRAGLDAPECGIEPWSRELLRYGVHRSTHASAAEYLATTPAGGWIVEVDGDATWVPGAQP